MSAHKINSAGITLDMLEKMLHAFARRQVRQARSVETEIANQTQAERQPREPSPRGLDDIEEAIPERCPAYCSGSLAVDQLEEIVALAKAEMRQEQQRLEELATRLRSREQELDNLQQELGRQRDELARERSLLGQRSAASDDLTGLHLRGAFLSLAEEQLKRARRTGKSSLLFFIDLDGLKQINDRFGHLAGDRALTAAADVFRDTFRDSDVIGRFGGDEFTILAIDAGMEQGALLRARLEDKLNELNRRRMLPFELSFSVGMVALEAGHTIEALIAAADRKMYEHKRAGRHGLTTSTH